MIAESSFDLFASGLSNKPSTVSGVRSFVEKRVLDCLDPKSGRRLQIRFESLVNQHGFRQISEVQVLFSDQNSSDPSLKQLQIRRSSDIHELKFETGQIKNQTCFLGVTGSGGTIQQKGRSILWDLIFKNSIKNHEPIRSIPKTVSQISHPHFEGFSTEPIEIQKGLLTIGNQTVDFSGSIGRLFLWSGQHEFKRSTWIHAPLLCTDQKSSEHGQTAENDSASFTLFSIPSFIPLCPAIIRYQGQEVLLTGLFSSISNRFKGSMTDMTFEFRWRDLVFKGRVSSELRHLNSNSFEDSYGGLLYLTQNQNASANLVVYRKGKLEKSFSADSTVFYESISPSRLHSTK